MSEQKFNYYKGGIVKIEDNTTTLLKSEDELVPGFYKVKVIETPFGTMRSLQTTQHKIPKNSIKYSRRFLDTNYLDKLFTKESKMIHEDLNIKIKVGYLLHGKQGSGKTTTMLTISKILIENYKACVFSVVNPGELEFILSVIEESKKIKPFISVILYDECEEDFRGYEGFIKRVLDGDLTPDNTIFICATNYIDRIPETIRDRPSRFKYVTDVSIVSEEELVYDILNNMNFSLREEIKLSVDELKVITKTCGIDKTMDQIKNIFTDSCFKKIDLEKVVGEKEEITLGDLISHHKSGGFHYISNGKK